MLQLLQTLIKNLKDQTPKGEQLRRLTAEWLKQPKMKAYLNLKSSRKKDSHDASLTKQLGAVLSYELYLIQYACGFKPNVNHKNEPNLVVSFFPHRLPFVSYGLFTMAAAASQVWPTKLMEGNTFGEKTGFVPYSVSRCLGRSSDSWDIESTPDGACAPVVHKAYIKPKGNDQQSHRDNAWMKEQSTSLIHPTWYTLTDHSSDCSSLFPARLSPMGWSEWSEQPTDPVTLYRYASMTRDNWMKEWMLSDQHQVPVMLTLPRVPFGVDLWSQKAALWPLQGDTWHGNLESSNSTSSTKRDGFSLMQTGKEESRTFDAMTQKTGFDHVSDKVSRVSGNLVDLYQSKMIGLADVVRDQECSNNNAPEGEHAIPVRLLHPILMASPARNGTGHPAVSKHNWYEPNQRFGLESGVPATSTLSPKMGQFQSSVSIPINPRIGRTITDDVITYKVKTRIGGDSNKPDINQHAPEGTTTNYNPSYSKASTATSSRYEELFEALFPYYQESNEPARSMGQYVSRIHQRLRSLLKKANMTGMNHLEFNELKGQDLSVMAPNELAPMTGMNHRVTPGELLAHRHVLFLPKYMSLSWKQRLAKYGLSVKRQNKTLYKRFKKRFYKKNTMKAYRFNYRTYESAGKRLGRRHRRPNWLAAQYLRLYGSIPGRVLPLPVGAKVRKACHVRYGVSSQVKSNSFLSPALKGTGRNHLYDLYASPHDPENILLPASSPASRPFKGTFNAMTQKTMKRVFLGHANSVRVGLTSKYRSAVSDQTKQALKEFGVWDTGSPEGFSTQVLKTWNRLYDYERRELADWYEQNRRYAKTSHPADFVSHKVSDLEKHQKGQSALSAMTQKNTKLPAWSVSLFYATTPVPDTYPETYLRLVYNRIQERILEMAAFLPNEIVPQSGANKKALERINEKQPQDYMQIPLTKPTLETTSRNKLSRELRRLVQKCLTGFRPSVLVNDPHDYVMNRIGSAWNMKYRLDPYADPAAKYPKTSEELETEETVTEIEDLEKQLFYKKLEQIFNLAPVKLPDLWRSKYWRSTSIDKTWRTHKLQDTRRTTHLTKYRAKDQANRRWQKRLDTILNLRSIFSRTANRVLVNDPLARSFPADPMTQKTNTHMDTVFDRNWLRRETKVTRKLTRLLGQPLFWDFATLLRSKDVVRQQQNATESTVVASYAHNLRVRPKMYENIYEKLWWSELPNEYFYKDFMGHEKAKPKVSWFNSSVDRSTPLTQMGLVLFHVCALFSLCTIPSVRDLLKFHVVLAYKLTDVYSPVMNVLSKIVNFATFGSPMTQKTKGSYKVSDDKVAFSGVAKSSAASFPEKLSSWLGHLFWDLKPTGIGIHDPEKQVATSSASSAIIEAPSINPRLWANQSYRILFLRSFSLAMMSFPQKLMAQPVELVKQVVWTVTNAYWKFMDTFFDKTSKYFADPWTGSSDMLAYVFFLPWAIDLVPAVPEQFESRMGLVYRRVSRSTVLWTSFLMGMQGTLLGPQIQRRMWSLAENWVQLFYQLDSDLARRSQYNRYWWDGWVEILVMASQHYGIVLTSGGQQDEENQRTRLFDLVRQDPEWSWFNPHRLPPGLHPDYPRRVFLGHEKTTSDFTIKLFGTQSQVIQPMNELEAWIEAPPAKSFTTIPADAATMATIGELIFQIMSGQWQSSSAQNFLVVGPEGPTKTEWLRALAGEVEIPLIQDSAYAYTTIVGDQPVGIQRLKQVFDAVTWHTPCLFLLEDIHMIGNRRTDALATDVTPKEFTHAMERPYVEFQHFDEMLFYSRHSLTHYRTPVRGDFANAVAAYDFCFNLFNSGKRDQGSKNKNENSSSSRMGWETASVPLGAKRADMTTSSRLEHWTLPGATQRVALSRLQGKGYNGNKGDVSRTLPPWQMWTLKLQDMTPSQPQDLVTELPMTGLTYFQQQKLEMDRTRYAMHAKITWLTQNRLVRKAGAVNIMNELLAILDQLRSQQGFAFFATTHVPEVLDPALRRPGRLDQTILLPSQVASKFAPLFASSSLTDNVIRLHSKTRSEQGLPCKRQPVSLPKQRDFTSSDVDPGGEGQKRGVEKTVASFEHVYGDPNRREMLKSLVYGNMAQRFTELTYQTATLRFGVSFSSQDRLNSWWSHPNELARSIMPAIASHTGETLVLGPTGRQSGNLLCAFARKNENAAFAGTDSKDIYSSMTSWMEKRGVVAPRGWLTALFNLQNQTPLSEPPSPPTGAALLPIKRYEYYRRIERDFQNPVRMGWKDKWNLQQSLRSSFVAYRTNYKPFLRSEMDSKSMTSYTSALKQLIGSIDMLGGSAIQRYVDSRLWNRHVDYLTNLWSNAHWPESKMEDNQEYYLLQCLPDQNVPEQAKDFYFDFPEPEQYYVPRQRRWMLHQNSWQYPESFTKDWYDDFYQHTVLEASARSLTWLDANREALDALSWTYVQQGWVKDLHVQSIWQRFLSSSLI